MKKVNGTALGKIRSVLKMDEERDLFKSGNAVCICVPVHFVRALGWKPGDTITQQIKSNRSIILKAKEGAPGGKQNTDTV